MNVRTKPARGGPVRSDDQVINFHLLNIRSVKQNLDSYISLLGDDDVHVIVLTETWLDPTNEDTFNIPGYKSFFSSNPNYRAGGVAIYVKANIPACGRYVGATRDCDCAMIELNTGGNKTQIAAVYRSPTEKISDSTRFAEEGIGDVLQAFDRSADCLLLGDINLCIFKQSGTTGKYLDNCASEGFICVNNSQPTRVTANGASLIDHVLFRGRRATITQIEAVDSRAVSDHMLLSFGLSTTKSLFSAPTTTRKRIDYNKLRRITENTDWSVVDSAESTDTASLDFQRMCLGIIENCSETVDCTNRQTPLKEWVTPGLVRSIRKRDEMHRKLKKKFSLSLKILYDCYKVILKRLIRKVKTEFYRKKFAEVENSSRGSWQLVNTMFGGRKRTSPLDPKLTNKSLDDINDHFATIGAKTVQGELGLIDPGVDLPESALMVTEQLNTFRIPTEAEVEILMRRLVIRKASGPDGIPVSFLRENRTVLAAPISVLTAKIIETATFPRNLKEALLYPIHKDGALGDLQNYRPISLLPVLSKVIERILADQLISHLEKFGNIHPNQYGFRPGRTTEDAALAVTEYASAAVDDGDTCIAIFCDITKAFDTIDRGRLINKLRCYGVGGSALELMASYLSHRTQIFKANGLSSNTANVEYGIPQGSVCGPLLFLVFINDVFTATHPHLTIAFADDTVIMLRGRDRQSTYMQASECITRLNAWMRVNGLILNTRKTKFMEFRQRSPGDLPVLLVPSHEKTCLRSHCKCPTIERVDDYKYLGLRLQSNLKFNGHVEAVRANMRRGIAVLSRMRRLSSICLRRQVYYSLVNSHMVYMLSIYGSTYKTALDPLRRLQKRAKRIMTVSTLTTEWNQVESLARVPSLDASYVVSLCRLKFYECERITRPTHKYSTRFKSTGNLSTPKANRTLAQTSVNARFIKIYNELPVEIKELFQNPDEKKKKILKERLKTFLESNATFMT